METIKFIFVFEAIKQRFPPQILSNIDSVSKNVYLHSIYLCSLLIKIENFHGKKNL